MTAQNHLRKSVTMTFIHKGSDTIGTYRTVKERLTDTIAWKIEGLSNKLQKIHTKVKEKGTIETEYEKEPHSDDSWMLLFENMHPLEHLKHHIVTKPSLS